MAQTFDPPASADSGTQGANDPTLVSGQDITDLFGVAIPYSTGAPGSAGASAQPQGDPSNEPGQYPATEPISGVSLSGMTGAPGSQGAGTDRPGQETVMVTDPNYTSGKPGGGSGVQMTAVPVAVSGPGDSTATPGNYPPAHPIAGSASPVSTGAGRGSVRRGGNMNGKRG